MTDKFLVSLFEHKAWADANMFDVMRAIPEDRKSGGIAYATMVLGHASLVDRVFRARLLGEEHAFKAVIPGEMPNLHQLWDTVRATDRWYVDYANRVSSAELAEVVDFVFVSDGDPGRMTKAEILAHVLTHSAAHRTQVAGLLGKAEIQGPAEMFTTFVSDGLKK